MSLRDRVMFAYMTDKGIILNVRLTPNASSAQIKGCFVGADGVEFLKVSVISVPEKGKANKELIDLLSKSLKLSKSKIELISGETDRYKKLLLDADEQILEKLVKLGDEK